MMSYDNPFSVDTPEQMTANEIVDLFVPIEESYNISVSSHVFIHGHRGSGKSMMLRRLAPDCQSLIYGKPIKELDFFGVYSSIKKIDIDIMDFSSLGSDSAQFIISEHLLSCFVVSKVISHIKSYVTLNAEDLLEYRDFFFNNFLKSIKSYGVELEVSENVSTCLLQETLNIIDGYYKYHTKYLRKVLSGLGKSPDYEGPLFSYFDFVVPVMQSLKSLNFMPNGPIYILIDDVDNLNLIQTKIINTWVSYRTTDIVSFKLATQMNYKTFLTISGRRIETPHDFVEIQYSNVYTGSKKDKYPEWVKEVTKKRLSLYYKKNFGIDVDIDPEDYFPFDAKQQKEIDAIIAKYKSGEIPSRSNRPSDDAYRYARPDYIVSLGGASKNTSTYKYAGFNQLVHLSSGVIRYFLEPASKMFSLQARHSNGTDFRSISPTNQDVVAREESDSLLFGHFDRITAECEGNPDPDNHLQTITRLRNLINVIGAMFFAAMKSNASERKFFSFALSDPENMSSELRRVLMLGVQEGFFYETHIGTKEGFGRTNLYVLTRRLAPSFNLDPIGFSAYKFVTCNFLQNASTHPKSLIIKLKEKGVETVASDTDPIQGSLL